MTTINRRVIWIWALHNFPLCFLYAGYYVHTVVLRHKRHYMQANRHINVNRNMHSALWIAPRSVKRILSEVCYSVIILNVLNEFPVSPATRVIICAG